MKRAFAVIGGGVMGVAISGLAAALVTPFASPSWRGETLVWATTAVVVVLAVATSWILSGWRRPPG